MELETLFQTVFSAVNGEEIRTFAGTFREFPVKLGFCSYAEGIDFLTDAYRRMGLESERIDFPADGKTVYADRHFPLAWDVSEAWAEVEGWKIADYDECTYCVIPFSADSGGVCESRIVPMEELPESGSLESFVALIAHYPSGAEIRKLMERSCKAFMTAVDLNPVDPSLEHSRRWFNDLFGAGQIDRRDRCCVGFSLSPAIARKLVERYRADGPVPVKYRMKTRSYSGKAPAATALLRGTESSDAFFLTAHAYEPHATNDVAGVAATVAAAAVLSRLIAQGVLPPPKRSIRFFHGMENFSLYAWGMAHPSEMKRAVGGLSLDSFGRFGVNDKKECFVLRRSLNVHPSAQHALMREILRLSGEGNGIGFEVREGSKNNEDLMQDPQFGPPWNLLYGSLWEEPRETYPRCYFYHTSVDTAEKLSPDALKAAAVMGAVIAYFLASAGEEEARFLSRLAFEDWRRIVSDKCREALRIDERDPELLLLRARRLEAWRALALKSAADSIGDAALIREFRAWAAGEFAAANTILTGKPSVAAPRREAEDDRIVRRLIPGPIGLGTIDDALRDLAAEAQGYRANEYWCFDDSGTVFYFFDGERSVFEVAKAVWATRAFKLREDQDELKSELRHWSKLADVLLRGGLAELVPRTTVKKEEILSGLRALGIRKGDAVMVHSSLSSFGRVEGGAGCVIDALSEAVGTEGILAMPAFTDCVEGGNSGVYDPERTPVEAWIGVIPEEFRKQPGTLRSPHPTHSVCARGSAAAEFLRQHDRGDCFAPDGPWAKLRDRGGKILFLGESVGGNTFLHACEAWYNSYLDATFARTGEGESVPVENYPGGCRGGWYKLGRDAVYFRKLEERGVFRSVRAGKAVLTLCLAGELAGAMKEIFAEDPAVLLHHENCRDCAARRRRIK